MDSCLTTFPKKSQTKSTIILSKGTLRKAALNFESFIWVVVKIIVPFGILMIIRHLKFRLPKKGL